MPSLRINGPIDARLLRCERDGIPRWRLLAPLSYLVGVGDAARCIVVPAGFETDFASIPRPFRWAFAPDSPTAARAAVLHDFLYSRGGCVSATGFGLPGPVELRLTRRACDSLLYSGMRFDGAGHAVASLFYVAVRIGGAPNWTRR